MDWQYLLPRPVRRLPADLAATILLTLGTVLVVFLPIIRDTPLRIALGLLFVIFLPGYAFIALLFPDAGESPTTDDHTLGEASDEQDTPLEQDADKTSESTDGWIGSIPGQDRGIDGIERVALSFGLSIAIVPLIGLILNFTPWGIRLTPILVAVSTFTIGCAIGAAYRRWQLPADERFSVPYREWIQQARGEVFEPDDRTDAVLNVLLAISILLAVGSVGYAVMVPPDGEQFTEYYLLTEDDDGELVAGDYPEDVTVNESFELILGIENHEHESMNYSTVVQLQDVETQNNETVVQDRHQLERMDFTLDHEEELYHYHNITPDITGDNLRLQYLLYTDEPPDSPTRDNAYRDVHLWMNVSN